MARIKKNSAFLFSIWGNQNCIYLKSNGFAIRISFGQQCLHIMSLASPWHLYHSTLTLSLSLVPLLSHCSLEILLSLYILLSVLFSLFQHIHVSLSYAFIHLALSFSVYTKLNHFLPTCFLFVFLSCLSLSISIKKTSPSFTNNHPLSLKLSPLFIPLAHPLFLFLSLSLSHSFTLSLSLHTSSLTPFVFSLSLFLSCSCSLWSIATIAFNRYVWICHWNNYHRIFNRRTVPLILLIVWLIAFLIDLPNILGWGVHEFDWKVSVTGIATGRWGSVRAPRAQSNRKKGAGEKEGRKGTWR